MRAIAPLLAVGLLAGCSTTREDAFREPLLTPVGSGLYQNAPIVQPAPGPGPNELPRKRALRQRHHSKVA